MRNRVCASAHHRPPWFLVQVHIVFVFHPLHHIVYAVGISIVHVFYFNKFLILVVLPYLAYIHIVKLHGSRSRRKGVLVIRYSVFYSIAIRGRPFIVKVGANIKHRYLIASIIILVPTILLKAIEILLIKLFS